MQRFEQIDFDDQLRIALEVLGSMYEAKQLTIERLAYVTDRTVGDVWRDACAEVGLDVCEPWNGFPKGPRKDSWDPIGAARELTPTYSELYQKMRGWLGRDKH
jgi:hypothetical protein